jgi:hypothetical protein
LQNIFSLKHIFLIFLTVFILYITHSCEKVYTESASFFRQEITDSEFDIYDFYNNYTTNSRCTDILHNQKFEYLTPPTIDIKSVSLRSDGTTLDATLWFYESIKDPFEWISDKYSTKLFINVSTLTVRNISLGEFVNNTLNDVYNNTLNDRYHNGSDFFIVSTGEGTLSNNEHYKKAEVRYYYGMNSSRNAKHFFIVKDNKGYDIHYETPFWRDEVSILKIINTIEITNTSKINESKLIEKENLKTYESALNIKLSFPNDWKINEIVKEATNKGDLILSSPARPPPWGTIGYYMLIDLNSVYDAGLDYWILKEWTPESNWTETNSELSYAGPKILETYDLTYNNSYENFVDFSLDLGSIGLPNQYNVIFFADTYLADINCYLGDVTNLIAIPPPQFILSVTPSSLELRPGDEKNMQLKINSNTSINSNIYLSTYSDKDNEIKANLTSTLISLLPFNTATSTLKVKALENATQGAYTLPISMNISFPKSFKLISSGKTINLNNSRDISINKNSSIIITVLPPFTSSEILDNFVKTWISPISGLWTFVAGVGAVIAPLIIRIYANRKKEKDKDRKLDDYSLT